MLVALIPARDEAARLGAVLDGLAVALPQARVVLIDDGSGDGTGEVARGRGALVLRTEGLGYAGALALGHGWAAEQGASAVIQLDADGQHPPAAAPALLAALRRADLVWASRQGTSSPGPWARKLGNRLLSAAVAAAGARAGEGARLCDVTSGYAALGPRAIAALARDWPGGTCDANLRVRAARAGLRLAELPVEMATRSGGASMHDGPKALRHLARSLRAVVDEARR